MDYYNSYNTNHGDKHVKILTMGETPLMAIGWLVRGVLCTTTYHFHQGRWEVVLPDLATDCADSSLVPLALLTTLNHTFSFLNSLPK